MPDLTDKYVRPGVTHNPNLTFLSREIGNYRYLCFPGGTRSGKTYSIIQWLWAQMNAYSGVKYSIVRATLNALKGTVLEDFVEIGKSAGLYTEANHHLTENKYRHHGNIVNYFGMDGDEKVRGMKRDVLYLNEGPEITWPEMKQLQWRTSAKILIDYNPSYPESWLYENILSRPDCAYITTNWEHNPHLSPGQVEEMHWMRDNDPESYIVYGLGQRGELKGQVYKGWKEISALPADYPTAFIVDFGYSNDPACIAQFSKHNKAIYGRQRLYQKGMDNIDLAIALHLAGATQDSIIIADSAEPKSVGELRYGWDLSPEYVAAKAHAMGHFITGDDLTKLCRALANGFPVLLARKGPDSVRKGIQVIKQHEVFITTDSTDAWREYRKYRWAEDKKTDVLLNAPVDDFNHFMDCLRYYGLAIGFEV